METITFTRHLDYLHTLATCISCSPIGRAVTPAVEVHWEDLDNPGVGRYAVSAPLRRWFDAPDYVYFDSPAGSILILPATYGREFGPEEANPCLVGGIESRIVDGPVPERPLIRLRAILEDLGILPPWWGPVLRIRFRAPVAEKLRK
jgi:hypothetical protein